MTTRELLVKINGDNSGLNNALIKTGEQLRAIEKNAKATAEMFTDFGRKMTMSVTLPIAAMGTAMVVAATEAEKASALLANSIKAVGNQGKVSAKALEDFASSLQKTTKYDDEVTIGAMTMLEQLTALDEKGLKAIIPSIQDFASAFGMDLQQAATLVGKTISSNTNALGRYGIQVDGSASQTEKLAQIMQGLARFQGTAAAEGKTFAGQLAILKNEAENLAESFGVIMLPILSDLIEKLRGIVDRFAALPDSTKKTILVVAGLAAAIGPVASAIGGLIQVVNMLKGAMILATGPAGWITLFVAGFALISIEIYKAVKAHQEYKKVLAGTSEKDYAEQIKMLEEALIDLQKRREAVLQGIKVAEARAGRSLGVNPNLTQIDEEIKLANKQIEALKEKKKAQEEATAAQNEANASGTVGATVIEDLTEAEKAYAAALEIAKAAINGNKTELEKLGEQFDILQNTQAKNSADEETRLRAMAILREAIYKLQLEEMAKLKKETKDLGEELNAFYGQTEDAAAGIASMGEAFTTSGEELTALSEYMNGTLLPTMDKVFDAVARVTGAIAGQDSELAKSISVWKDWIGGFGKLIAGDWIGGILQMIDGLTKAINMNTDAMKKSKTAMEEAIKVTSTEGDAIEELYAKLANVNAIIPYLPEDMAAPFIKVANELKKQIKDSFQVSIVDALNEALMAGSYADFSQAIGKMVYSVASQFILTAVGIKPMIEKLSAMIVSALEDGAIDASEMSAIQAEAANIYNTASAALAPLQAIVNSTFGTSIGIPSTSGSTGGISETETEAIGSFASGVRNWRGGLARVGEQGPETVYLPRGASVEPAAAARGGATINIYSPKALDPMSARANMLAASRQLAFETGGNF